MSFSISLPGIEKRGEGEPVAAESENEMLN